MMRAGHRRIRAGCDQSPIERARSAPLVLACVLAALAVARPVRAQTAPPGDESLLFAPIETVSAASRFDQAVTEAPASVTILTAEQIRQMGYRTLGEALQSVRGFFVTDDHNYSYLGSRGFNRPGDYNVRVLLLVDGRRLNDPVYDQALMGTEALVDMDLVERIEVVRGPGSSMYGPNALLTVVNVVTFRGRDRAGLRTTIGGGSLSTGEARASYGKLFGKGADLLVSASYYRSLGASFYFPEFDSPATNDGVAEDCDRDERAALFGKLSAGPFTLVGAWSDREKRIPTGSYGTLFNDPRTRTFDDQGFLDLRYEAPLRGGGTLTARAFFTHYGYRGTYIYEEEAEDGSLFTAPFDDSARGDRLGLEVQYALRPLGSHRLLAGAEVRDDFRQSQTVDYLDYSFEDRGSTWNGAVFAQDQWSLTRRLTVSLGLRHDRYGSRGSTNPRVGLIYSPKADSAVKLLYGRGYRPPNAYELAYDDGFTQKGNPALEPETIDTFELAWEHPFGRHLRGSISAYYYRVDDLVSQATDPADERIYFVNSETLEAGGIEAELIGRWESGLEGRTSYSLQEAQAAETGDELTNSPRHMFKLYASVPVIRGRLSLGLEQRCLSRRITLSGGQVDGYCVTNLNLLAPRLYRGLEASLGVYNAFDADYFDPGGAEHVQDGLVQYGRTLRFQLRYAF